MEDINMKKVLKWIGIVLGSLLGLLLVALVVLYFSGSARLNRNYNIQVDDISRRRLLCARHVMEITWKERSSTRNHSWRLSPLIT
jgi:hypothetical protein